MRTDDIGWCASDCPTKQKNLFQLLRLSETVNACSEKDLLVLLQLSIFSSKLQVSVDSAPYPTTQATYGMRSLSFTRRGNIVKHPSTWSHEKNIGSKSNRIEAGANANRMDFSCTYRKRSRLIQHQSTNSLCINSTTIYLK